jgi:hypothetical protein
MGVLAWAAAVYGEAVHKKTSSCTVDGFSVITL